MQCHTIKIVQKLDIYCVLSNKFGSLAVKTLKMVLSDFYSVDALSAAKIKLLRSVDSLSLSSKRPHIPQRREGNERLSRKVDDLIALFTFLDEQKCSDQLPIYVSDIPDNMPSVRLYEGDVNVLINLIII